MAMQSKWPCSQGWKSPWQQQAVCGQCSATLAKSNDGLTAVPYILARVLFLKFLISDFDGTRRNSILGYFSEFDGIRVKNLRFWTEFNFYKLVLHKIVFGFRWISNHSALSGIRPFDGIHVWKLPDVAIRSSASDVDSQFFGRNGKTGTEFILVLFFNVCILRNVMHNVGSF